MIQLNLTKVHINSAPNGKLVVLIRKKLTLVVYATRWIGLGCGVDGYHMHANKFHIIQLKKTIEAQ